MHQCFPVFGVVTNRKLHFVINTVLPMQITRIKIMLNNQAIHDTDIDLYIYIYIYIYIIYFIIKVMMLHRNIL